VKTDLAQYLYVLALGKHQFPVFVLGCSFDTSSGGSP
jgi:hypothetical protein